MNYFITGANRGLGCQLVKNTVEQGHSVIATVRKQPVATEPLAQLQQDFSEKMSIVEMDAADEASVEKVADVIQQTFGHVDVVINNAGVIGGRGEKAEELTIDAIQYCFDINVLGPVRVVKHFLPLLKEGTDPAIVNISSDAGSISHTGGGDYAYGISKAAVNMYTAQLDKELRENNIYVAAIHPGWMKTDMGGNKAPLQPDTSAKGILSIINERKESETSLNYFDYSGKEMEV